MLGLGFWQEYRAERTLAALKGMLTAHARVRRDGPQVAEVDACQMVACWLPTTWRLKKRREPVNPTR